MDQEISALAASTVALGRTLEADFQHHASELNDPVAFGDTRAALSTAIAERLRHGDFLQTLCQSLACVATVSQVYGSPFASPSVRQWALNHANPILRRVLADGLRIADAAVTGVIPQTTDRTGVATYFFERFLAKWARKSRAAHGVFFTPRPVASFIVRQVDCCLRREFGIRDGLAERDASVPIKVFDPALGTGVFLLEAIDCIHDSWSREPRSITWSQFVVEHLLPRLCGIELMLPSCLIAYMSLVAKLAETGFDFRPADEVRIHVGNSLAGPTAGYRGFNANDTPEMRAATIARAASSEWPATVIVGNPPFSGISRQKHLWIDNLLKGRNAAGSNCCSYFRVDGEPLGERKHWLGDDYVKFIRLAHWKVENSGFGVIGFVTNHGYLDNPTFRAMRFQLQRTFPKITVIDLHGNRKKGEQSPDGGTDGNVFAIDQGTAIGLFRKSESNQPNVVQHGELWGSIETKLSGLKTALDNARVIHPKSPDYLFVPRDEQLRDEYETGIDLPTMMPVNVTAPVTARDSLVVAFNREELIDRLNLFRDLSIPDEEIRRQLVSKTRSTRYPPGDTRGWKLADARRQLAACDNWREHIRPLWYRPFDRRVVFWADWMVDWPRNDVTQHLIAGDNLAIVARRQMLPTRPCNYFWITDQLTLDGIIRSDNRGSESIFPLMLSGPNQRRANLDAPMIELIARTLKFDYRPAAASEGETWSAVDWLYATYALFFSQQYRQRYAPWLRCGFPRVFVPNNRKLFNSLRAHGKSLADIHLMRAIPLAPKPNRESQASTPPVAEPGYPKYRAQGVLINRQTRIGPIQRDVWDYRIGGHQVLRKWLRDRRTRRLTDIDIATYCQIVAAISDTLQITREIDTAIGHHGGLPAAFIGV